MLCAWLLIAALLVPCGGGNGRSEANAADQWSVGAAATVARFFDGLRRTEYTTVRATLASDYQYDRSEHPTFDPADPFNSPFALTYRSLSYHLEALTRVGNTVTAVVTTIFEADLNLAFVLQMSVFGTGRLILELEPRDGEWKLTAVRLVRVTFRNKDLSPPEGMLLIGPVNTLYHTTVNDLSSARVPAGTPLTLSGKARFVASVFGVIGSFSLLNLSRDRVELKGQDGEQWTLPQPLQAPDTPGRFLAYALSLVAYPDPTTQETRVFGGDLVTVPVTVIRPR
jgi:hypothetical protein